MIREFECEECGLVQEAIAGAGVEPKAPMCCGRWMDRRPGPSRTSFQLKGDGWPGKSIKSR